MNKGWVSKNIRLIAVLLGLVIISFLLINLRKIDKDSNISNNTKEEKIKLVDDYSRFFTVNSCISKFINCLSQKNNDSIYKLLNVDYISNNNITVSNVINFVDNLDGNYSFSSRKMYYEKIDENNYKYYIYGFLSQENIDGKSENIEKYFIVNLYTKNMLFDIAPYDGKIFKEGL